MKPQRRIDVPLDLARRLELCSRAIRQKKGQREGDQEDNVGRRDAHAPNETSVPPIQFTLASGRPLELLSYPPAQAFTSLQK